MKILIIADYIGKNVKGGAGKSLNDIIDYLQEDYELDFLEQISGTGSKIFKMFGFDYIINLIRIHKKVRQFKPHVILTQLHLSFPAIIYANAKNIPIINFIHDISDICPKYMDIIDYGVSCNNYLNKKQCFKCINNWKHLRIEIGNRPTHWDTSIKARVSTLFYKCRYYLCRVNKKILLQSQFNFVPSDLLQDKLYPIQSRVFNFNFFDLLELEEVINNNSNNGSNNNTIVYVVPEYNDAHKGTDFIYKLADEIPNAHFLIVGKTHVVNFGKYLNTSDMGRIEDKKLFYGVLKKAKIVLMPTLMTESFGRVAIESLLQGTPVICSDNVGSAYTDIFRDEGNVFLTKDYIKIIPINVDLWVEAIKKILDQPMTVPAEQIKKIQRYFSKQNSKNDLHFVLQMIYFIKYKGR